MTNKTSEFSWTEFVILQFRGEYISQVKRYSTHKFDDTNHETLRKGTAQVYVNFIFVYFYN